MSGFRKLTGLMLSHLLKVLDVIIRSINRVSVERRRPLSDDSRCPLPSFQCQNALTSGYLKLHRYVWQPDFFWTLNVVWLMFRPERPIKSCVTANVGHIKKTQAVKSLRVNLRLCVSEHQCWASYFETVIRLLVTERCYSLTGEHR